MDLFGIVVDTDEIVASSSAANTDEEDIVPCSPGQLTGEMMATIACAQVHLISHRSRQTHVKSAAAQSNIRLQETLH